MKKFLCIAMALVFVFFAAPAMAADVYLSKGVLPEAETSLVQMTNNELSAVRGGWSWTSKIAIINTSSPSTTTSATAISTSPGQVNNVDVNTGTESLNYNSQTNGGYGFRTVIIGFRPLRVVEQDPAPSP